MQGGRAHRISFIGVCLRRFKTQEICNEAVRNKLCMLLFIPDLLWTQEMCNEIMRTMPNAFHRIPDRFKTQEALKLLR